MATQEVLECGHPASAHVPSTSGLVPRHGYGIDPEGNRHCYACCAVQDAQQMQADGKITLYLGTGEVTNWPGSLRLKVNYQRKGRHNLAGVRYDVWFTGPDGDNWHGVQYGNMTQLVHCTRIR